MLTYRQAIPDDASLLALMNHQLIRDENHRNPMTPAQLEQRMHTWLTNNEYTAILFKSKTSTVGYALYQQLPDHTHLRHFFIQPQHRRQRLGTAAFHWLLQNLWKTTPRLRLDVLIHNHPAIAFYHSLNFTDYALTMERIH